MQKYLLFVPFCFVCASVLGQDNCKNTIYETIDEATQQTLLSSKEIPVLSGKKVDFKINFYFLKRDSVFSLKVDCITKDMNSQMSIFYIHLFLEEGKEIWLEDYKTGTVKTIVKNKSVTAAKQTYFKLSKEQVETLMEDEIRSIEIRYFNQKEEPYSREIIGIKTALKIKTVVACMQ